MASKKGKGTRIGSMLHDALFYDCRMEQLSPSGFKLLIELNQQFSGFNNGNLCAAIKCLRFKWNDKSLKKARRELIDKDFIRVTKRGKGRRPTLYALCHLPINEIEKHNIKAETTCTKRATGKREHYYPVRRDLPAEVVTAFDDARKKKEAKNNRLAESIQARQIKIGG